MNTSSERFEKDAGATSRVIVRACEASDMEAIADITSQPGVRRGTLTLGYRTPEAMTSWFAGLPAGSVTLCAELDGRVVGHAGMVVAAARRAHSTPPVRRETEGIPQSPRNAVGKRALDF